MYKNEQERWDTILANVKNEGGRIRKRRLGAVISVFAACVVLGALLLLTQPEKNEFDESLFAERSMEIEMTLTVNDIVYDENIGVFY